TAAEKQDLSQEENPFVFIPLGYRMLIIGYVLVYNIFVPGLSQIFHSPPTHLVELYFAIFVVDALYRLLLFLPLFFYRSTYGWLHPLIFPAIYSLAKILMLKPGHLLTPFLFNDLLSHEITHVALQGWSQDMVAWAALKAQLISLAALAIYYMGFFFGPQVR